VQLDLAKGQPQTAWASLRSNANRFDALELSNAAAIELVRLVQTSTAAVGETAFERCAQELKMPDDLRELIKALIPLDDLHIEEVLVTAIAGIARKVFVGVVASLPPNEPVHPAHAGLVRKILPQRFSARLQSTSESAQVGRDHYLHLDWLLAT
jgi:hypothetical protein